MVQDGSETFMDSYLKTAGQASFIPEEEQAN